MSEMSVCRYCGTLFAGDRCKDRDYPVHADPAKVLFVHEEELPDGWEADAFDDGEGGYVDAQGRELEEIED